MAETDWRENWFLFSWAGLLSKSLIQFSVDGWGCVPSLLFDLGPNYGGVNEDNGDLLQKFPCKDCYPQSPPPPPQKQATTNPHVCWRLLGESGSVSCGVTAPFSWVLMHKVLFVPSKSLFPQSCVSSGSMMWFMATSSKRAYAISRSLHPEPLLSRTSSGDNQTQFCLSLFGVSGTWCAQGLFEPSEHFW